ncbi:MAG: hypothetical protein HYR84_10625, partial [Planctomycetes bacterium]|nr:hypothetical protein [Planctomycetota bacterium]
MATVRFALCVVLATFASTLSGQENDPLPPGATARLGTARLRHPGPVNQAAFVHAGKAFLSAGADHTIRLWDVKTGRELRRFGGESFFLSPDQKTLVTADNSIRVWHFDTGKELPFSPLDRRHQRYLDVGVGFTPDGSIRVLTMFFAHDDPGANQLIRRIQTWNLHAGKRTHEWTIPDGDSYVSMSPDGRTVVNRNNGPPLSLRNGESGELQHKWPFDYSRRNQFSPDGRTIATGGDDTSVMLWDIAHFTKPIAPGKAVDKLTMAWTELASEDAGKAGRAMLALVRADADAVAFLRTRVPPIAPADKRRLMQLVSDLDSVQFPVREAARIELEKLGDLALPALRGIDINKRSVEGTRRVAEIIERITTRPHTPETLRTL